MLRFRIGIQKVDRRFRVAPFSTLKSKIYTILKLRYKDHIDDTLNTYSWYHKLVVVGAEKQQIPDDYIAGLQAVPHREDPKSGRKNKQKAEDALNVYNSSIGNIKKCHYKNKFSLYIAWKIARFQKDRMRLFLIE